MGLVWDEGSRELGIMTNSRFPDYLRVGNSGIHRTGLSHHRRGRCSMMFRRQDHRVGSGGFRRVGKGMECGAMRGGENAHHKRVRWAHTEGSKCYGKFPISRSLNNREFGKKCAGAIDVGHVGSWGWYM